MRPESASQTRFRCASQVVLRKGRSPRAAPGGPLFVQVITANLDLSTIWHLSTHFWPAPAWEVSYLDESWGHQQDVTPTFGPAVSDLFQWHRLSSNSEFWEADSGKLLDHTPLDFGPIFRRFS